MITNNVKKAVLASAILCATVTISTTASAHNINAGVGPAGAGELSSLARAYDVYQTSCFSWAAGGLPAHPAGEANGPATKFFTRIKKLTGGGAVRVTTAKTPGAFVLPVSTVASDSTLDATYGVRSLLPGGNGNYIMVVSHTAAVANTYDVEFHCENALNQHTGTGSLMVPHVGPSTDYLMLINSNL